jgi:uncharacterized repeat protein (TIGR03803 family)
MKHAFRFTLPLTWFVAITCALGAMKSLTLAQTETVLYRFQGGDDGANPWAGLILDEKGNLFGTTEFGGGLGTCVLGNSCGTAFELSPTADGSWTKTILHCFAGGSEGGDLRSGVIFDPSGNLYGTTIYGGDTSCESTDGGCGTVFELSPSASGWDETVLYAFNNNSPGFWPVAGVTFDKFGNLYGTSTGGTGTGTVFELAPNSGGGWTETTISHFGLGQNPLAGVIVDPQRNVYGTLSIPGVVFELIPSTSGWTEATIGHGSNFYAGLTFDRRGNLYSTINGAPFGYGSVFELVHSATGWKEEILYTFKGGNDGASPGFGSLIFDKAGNLYGTTASGGSSGNGTVFKLTPNSNGSWSESVVYSFHGGRDGAWPQAGLVFDGHGDFYGTTYYGGGGGCSGGCGTVFEITL